MKNIDRIRKLPDKQLASLLQCPYDTFNHDLPCDAFARENLAHPERIIDMTPEECNECAMKFWEAEEGIPKECEGFWEEDDEEAIENNS